MTANTFQFASSLNFYDRNNNKVPTPNFSTTAPGYGLYSDRVTVAPGQSATLFSGLRTISADNTTIFTFTLSPLVVDPIYRFTWTGGTAPVLRTDRGVDLTAQEITVTLNANETVSVAASAGDFAAVQVGDNVFVPGVLTGDPTGPFSETNVGFWVVLAKDGTSSTLQLSRRTGDSFSGITETITVAAASDFQVFSATGVQRGDGVDVLAGFSAPILRLWTVREVTATWFEVVASDPLPSEEEGTGGTPPNFYSEAKRLIWVEVDQEALVLVNGGSQRVSPIQAGSIPGFHISSSPVYSLAVTNRSAQEMVATARGIS